MKRLFVEDEMYGDLRPATLEDLYEALGGEDVWYCYQHKAGVSRDSDQRCVLRNQRRSDCRMVKARIVLAPILTPALDQGVTLTVYSGPNAVEDAIRDSDREDAALDQEKET
jgi:hypothetical protein